MRWNRYSKSVLKKYPKNYENTPKNTRKAPQKTAEIFIKKRRFLMFLKIKKPNILTETEETV